MKKYFHAFLFSFFCLTSFILCLPSSAIAGPGDTLTVQTFTFGSPQDGWFVFPSDTVRYEKVLMKYTLKCNPAQQPACGEWDYLTYSYLYQPSIDSTILNAPNYMVNGASPDSFQYITQAAYQLNPWWNYYFAHDDTVSLSTYTVGAGASTLAIPFNASQQTSRTQFLWYASELTAAGLTAGPISALQFYVTSGGGTFQHLYLGIGNVTGVDSLPDSFFWVLPGNFQLNNVSLVPGWNNISLPYSFPWDGVSDLIIQLAYDNNATASDVVIASDATTFAASEHAGEDAAVHFNDANYISVPAAAFASVDSFITVSLWFKGDPFLDNRTTFEANNIYDSRVLNVHLPWSDGNIYWDAGSGLIGGYDRIYKAAAINEYETDWHHWAFTKNCATGSMKIYKDGHLWHSGTGATRLMKDVKTFFIGAALWDHNIAANGSTDEFAVWNAELDSSALLAYLNKDLDASHPFAGNLLVYYKFNQHDQYTVHDMSGNGFDGSIIGAQSQLIAPVELFRNIQTTHERPQIIFEQGVFDGHPDSTLIFDTTWIAPLTLTLYNDPYNPSVATDSQFVWAPYYQYVFDASGNIVDSVWISATNTIYHSNTTYSSGAIPVLRRFEIARYITPYGNNLTLGTGWTWTYDVSDYATLLHDSVYLSAGNWQELLDVKFMIIEGTPPRDPTSVTNIWNGDVGYGPSTETFLAAKDIFIPNNAVNTRFKLRITGHGADNNNCAEFCAKNCYLKIDNQQQYQKLIWRQTCPINPLYPQGGTWVYQRANWCPGAEVETYDWELTPFVTPGTTANLDLNLQPYSGSGGANYVTESQMVTYYAPNFSLNAAVLDILTPTNDQMYLRHNPICNNPLIRIRNNGTTPLTSLTITYGVENGQQQTYQWSGNLAFLQIEDVQLGHIFQSTSGNSNKFTATVSNPNGGVDEYVFDNSATTVFNYTPQYPSHVIMTVKTNNYGYQDDWSLTDVDGNMIVNHQGNSDNTYYRDTLNLPNGCYIFRLTDSGDDGLSFWANTAQGVGLARFVNADNGSIIKTFGADCGGEIYQQFTVGYYLNEVELPQAGEMKVNVYPNPSHGEFMIDILLPERKNVEVMVTDVSGKEVYRTGLQNILSQGLNIDLGEFPSGMYLLEVNDGNKIITKKLMLAK